MGQNVKPRPGLSIAAVLFAGEAFVQALRPPFRWWEVAVALFSILVAWGLLRANKVAWGAAVFGAVAQFSYGVTELMIWPALAGLVLFICLLWPSARADVFHGTTDRHQARPGSGPEGSLRRWSQFGVLPTAIRLEELAMSLSRRVVIRSVIGVVCLFFLVSIVGSWHEKLRRDTTVTDAVWAVVVTTYKIALVALVLLVIAAVFGASFRKRQGAQPRDGH